MTSTKYSIIIIFTDNIKVIVTPLCFYGQFISLVQCYKCEVSILFLEIFNKIFVILYFHFEYVLHIGYLYDIMIKKNYVAILFRITVKLTGAFGSNGVRIYKLI